MSKETPNLLSNGSVYVRWTVMILILGVLGALLTIIWTEVNEGNKTDLEFAKDISAIQTDVSWLKNIFNNNDISLSPKR